MRNLKLTMAYDGTRYVGWQIQPNGPSIQSAVETAIEKLTGLKTSVLVAGRTDSGVHAFGQVASFLTESTIPANQVQTGLQNFLPDDIVIRDVSEVPLDFHATYWAKSKRYRYVIQNSAVLFPFLRHYAWSFRADLDAAAMHAAAQVLLGTHDFRCFESQFPNKATSVRTVLSATVQRVNPWPVWTQTAALSDEIPANQEFICFDIVADGFLYNMVRAIMGTLIKVGKGQWSSDDVRTILTEQDRSQAGETAPAHGLYLMDVNYHNSRPE